MNYYPFHVGDYSAHTGHLEPMEDLAYRRLLDQYYLREGPLPADIEVTAKLIRMRSQKADVESVLREFFVLEDSGWTHARCDSEIERMRDKQAKAKASGIASANARAKARSATVERPLDQKATDVERTLPNSATDVQLPTPTPTPTPEEKKGEIVVGGVGEGETPPEDPCVSDAPPPALPAVPPVDPNLPKGAAAKRPDDVDAQTWSDFLALRKAKKAPVTETVLKRASAEAQKAGMPLAQFLAVWCARGSQGLEAAWLTPEERRPRAPAAAQVESFRERDDRLARERWEEMTGRRRAAPGDVIDITPVTPELPL